MVQHYLQTVFSRLLEALLLQLPTAIAGAVVNIVAGATRALNWIPRYPPLNPCARTTRVPWLSSTTTRTWMRCLITRTPPATNHNINPLHRTRWGWRWWWRRSCTTSPRLYRISIIALITDVTRLTRWTASRPSRTMRLTTTVIVTHCAGLTRNPIKALIVYCSCLTRWTASRPIFGMLTTTRTIRWLEIDTIKF